VQKQNHPLIKSDTSNEKKKMRFHIYQSRSCIPVISPNKTHTHSSARATHKIDRERERERKKRTHQKKGMSESSLASLTFLKCPKYALSTTSTSSFLALSCTGTFIF